MEFQQGMTLIIAGVSALFGAGVTWGLTTGKVKALEKDVKDIKEKVVWKDTCAQCQNKWSSSILALQEDNRRIEDKLDRILERLQK